METISDFQPILTWLVETHLQKEDGLGYQGLVRYSTSGGIMLAVKENIKNSYIRGYSGKVNWVKLVDIAT